MKPKLRIALVTLILGVVTIPNAAPFVVGDDVIVDGTFLASNDGAVPYDTLVNWANSTNETYTNRNLTINPFQAQNPDLEGVAVSPILAPSAVLQNSSIPSGEASPVAELVERGSKVSGTFPTDVSTSNNQSIKYSEENVTTLQNLTLFPSGPGFGEIPTWDGPGCTTTQKFSCIADGDNGTYLTTVVLSDADTFTMQDPTITPGWTDIDVVWSATCRRGDDPSGGEISHEVYVDGFSSVGADMEFVCPSAAPQSFYFLLTQAPDTSEWTETAVDHMECGMKSSTDTTPEPRVYEVRCYVLVSYAASVRMTVYYNWALTSATTGTLCLEAWHTDTEDILVQVWNSTTYNTRLTVTATSDPNSCQSYTFSTLEMAQGPILKFIGSDETASDLIQTNFTVDHAVVVTYDATSIDLVQPIFFTQQSVMDGISISWWRSPIGNISNGTDITFRLFRSDSVSTNVSSVNETPPNVHFTNDSNVRQVWSWSGQVSDSMPPFLGRRISITVDASRAIFYNFTWLPVYAPIVPNTYYYAYWHVSSATKQYTLFYSTNDVGNDGRYSSWLRLGNTTTYIPADSDQTVIMTFGMSAGIAGIPNFCRFWNVTCDTGLTFGSSPVIFFNMTFSNVLISNTIGARRYLNIVQPIYNLNQTNGTGMEWQATVYNQESGELTVSGPDLVFGKTDLLFQRVVDLDTYNGNYLHNKHVTRIDFRYVFPKEDSFSYIAADPTGQATVDTEMCNPDVDTCSWLTMRFKLYGYFSIDSFFFENTDRNIVLIPVEEPTTALGRLEAFQRWQSRMAISNPSAQPCTLDATWTELGVVAFTGIIGLGIQSAISGRSCIINAVLQGLSWVLNTVMTPLAQIFTGFLFTIGSFVLQLVQMAINALQWFAYWVVAFINVFIVTTVFAIIILAPSYVGRGILEWVRSDFDTDVMRETFRDGWARVWSLIQLLLTFVTMVLSALAAVAGIIGGLIP